MDSHLPSYIISWLHLFNVENFRIIHVTTCEVFIKMSHHLVIYFNIASMEAIEGNKEMFH